MRAKSYRYTAPLLVASLALAGCGADGDGKKDDIAEPAIPAGVVGVPGDPSKPISFDIGGAAFRPGGTLSMPLDAYVPRADRVQMFRALDILDRECMKELGVDWPGQPREQGMDFPIEAEYGVIDLEWAKLHGYEVPPAQDTINQPNTPPPAELSNAAVAAYFGNPDKKEVGCEGKSQQKLSSGKSEAAFQYVQELQGKAHSKAINDSRVREVTSLWSKCMKDSGFSYPDPMATITDKALLGKGGVPSSTQEKTVATADATCKRTTQYVQVRAVVTAAYQKVFIENSADRLRAGQDEWSRALVRTNDVLQGKK
ncbi:hypothetical protein ACFXEL_29860 [Streptomyces sp. NPDC059382]|uniref:hypothetical protein n=1 Tax=Streptomyces sp. NPDC059382 TaxID=3346816 RepID=UPI00368A0FF9